MVPRIKNGDFPVLAAAGLMGALFYWFRFGLGFLNPARVDWLLGMADTAFSQLAWTFFRHDSWHWPPGLVTTFMAPGGTTIGSTDSLPLLAFPGKVLSFLLPETFQYAGLWLLFSHVLMAVFAVRVAGVFFRPLLPRFFAAGILVLCPAWLIRDGHFALSSHWVLLAALWLYLKPASVAPGRRPFLSWWVLLAVTAWIHPYLAVLVFLFMIADQVRRWWETQEIAGRQVVLSLGLGVVFLIGLWYLAGFVRLGQLPTGNLSDDHLWSASLHAIWDSQGRSLLLPEMPLGDHDPFEGFVYFGAGGLLAALAAVVFGGGRKLGERTFRHWPLVLMLFVTAVYATGPRTDLGDQLFRAQARFLWPHFFVLVAAGLAALARLDRPQLPLTLTALFFGIQVLDLAPLFDRQTHYDATVFESRLKDPQWGRAMDQTDLLLTFPASTALTVFEDDFVDLTLLAHEAGVPTTAGFASRSYLDNILAAENLAKAFLFGGHPDPRTVAVLRRSHFAEMFPDFAPHLRCTDLDGFPVCFAREGGFRPDLEYRVTAVDLADFLAENMDQTVILAGKGEARRALTQAAVTLLSNQGLSIAQLPAGASYASILVQGKVVFEQMHPRNAIEVTGMPNTRLGHLMIRKELSVTASGSHSGGYASLKVDGREVLFNRDGLNVAVLDHDQNVLAVGAFTPHPSPGGPKATEGGLVFTLERVR